MTRNVMEYICPLCMNTGRIKQKPFKSALGYNNHLKKMHASADAIRLMIK